MYSLVQDQVLNPVLYGAKLGKRSFRGFQIMGPCWGGSVLGLGCVLGRGSLLGRWVCTGKICAGEGLC